MPRPQYEPVPLPANWASTPPHGNRTYLEPKHLGILPPLAVIVAALALFFALFRQGSRPLLNALPIYLLFAAPHFAALLALLKAAPRRTALIGGFLSGFWTSLVLYLLFIGMAVFSQEFSHGYQKAAWFAGEAMGVWMTIGGLSSVKLDKSSYWRGAVAGFLYPYATMVCLAMYQRGH